MLVLPPANCLAHAQRPEVAGESLPDKHVLNQPTAITVRPRTSPLLFSRRFSSCPWKAELNKTSDAGQPPWFVSVVLLPAPMISKMSLHYKIKTDQKNKNYKKHGSHLIFLKIIHNPVPLRQSAIFFNLPRWDGIRWSYWGRTPFRSSRILCCSQQTAAHWLLKQHRLLPFSQEPKGQTADAAKQSSGTWKIQMGHANKTPNNQFLNGW